MDKLLQIADSIAPSLAEGLRGPLQAQALLFVFKQFKVKNIEQLEEKLDNNDKSLSLLQNAQTNYEKALANAPVLEKTSLGELPQITVTILYNVGYFVLLWAFIEMTFTSGIQIDEWVKGIVGTLIGVLTAQLPDVNGYWFRSSSSSAKKTEALAANKKA
jgi:hypothetical protein